MKSVKNVPFRPFESEQKLRTDRPIRYENSVNERVRNPGTDKTHVAEKEMTVGCSPL